jgi:F-type H+-transporting ATPase subunit c
MKRMFGSLVMLLASAPAWAQEAAAHGTTGDKGLYALGAGIAIGVAALGGTLAQGRIGGSAQDGIARNPQAAKNMFLSMVLSLALVESLVVLAFVIAILIQQKF